MKTTQHKASKCPTCGHKLNASSHHSGVPSAGDCSVCIDCGSILEYKEDLTLRGLTTEELAKIEHEEPHFYKEIMGLQRRVDERDEDSRVPD